MYRLFGAKGAGSASVEFALSSVSAEYELLDAAPWGDPPSPAVEELKKINPVAQIPTLIAPGGEVLTELVPMLWTILERHVSPLLPPPSTLARARCLRYMMFVAGNVHSIGGVADYPERFIDGEEQRKQLEAGVRARLRIAWDVVAQAYEGTPFFVWDELSIGDVYLANTSRWWGMRKHLETAHPEFLGMLKRVEALPQVAAIWKRNFDT